MERWVENVRSDRDIGPSTVGKQTDAGVSSAPVAALHLRGQHSRTNFSHDIVREGDTRPLSHSPANTKEARYIEWQRKRQGDAVARRDVPTTNFWRTRKVSLGARTKSNRRNEERIRLHATEISEGNKNDSYFSFKERDILLIVTYLPNSEDRTVVSTAPQYRCLICNTNYYVLCFITFIFK